MKFTKEKLKQIIKEEIYSLQMSEVDIGPGDQAIDMGSQSKQERNQESAKKVDQMIEMWRQLGIKHGKEIESAELADMWNMVNLKLGQFAMWLDQGAEALASGGYDLDETIQNK